MADLVALNVCARLVMDDRGDVMRVVSLFDEFGELTDNPAEAVGFVAGPTREGRFWAATVREFERGPVH